ncbi:hypothetical protein ACFLS0_01875 [Candidatus Bipolaricaulota bacterium]
MAEHLGLRTYGDPVIYSLEAGMGKEENSGFDAFVPLVDSGISAHVWTQVKFASIVLYTCKGSDEDRGIAYSRDAFQSRSRSKRNRPKQLASSWRTVPIHHSAAESSILRNGGSTCVTRYPAALPFPGMHVRPRCDRVAG